MSEVGVAREWLFYIDDMIGFCERVAAFTLGITADQFAENAMCYDATVRNIELIGEAATHIPSSIRHAHNEIPWRTIIATRNKLIHAYAGIDDEVLWSIVRSDIPTLLGNLRLLKASHTGSP